MLKIYPVIRQRSMAQIRHFNRRAVLQTILWETDIGLWPKFDFVVTLK
jgi:hypothetical protein